MVVLYVYVCNVLSIVVLYCYIMLQYCCLYCSSDVHQFNEQGALAVFSPGGREPPPARSLFLTLTVGYYNENFHVDMPQTFHTSDRRLTLLAPSLEAHLDYTPIKGVNCVIIVTIL